MAALVTVYDKDGQPHKKTITNARDAVTNSGWTWKPGKTFHPTSGQPYAGMNRDTDTKARIQTILDRVGPTAGAKSAMTESHDELPTPQIEIEEVPDHVLAAQALGVSDAAETEATADDLEIEGDADADAETPAPAAGETAAAAPARRGRAKKTA